MKRWTPNQIRELRQSLGETQSQFADRLGVSVDTIVSWEQPAKREDGTPNKRHRKPSGMGKKLLDTIANSAKK